MANINNLFTKLENNGKLLEIIRSTDAQKEYLNYFYKNKFYRIIKHMGKVIDIVKIKKSYISEFALYNLTK